MSVVITGGKGCLASSLVSVFENDFDVCAPSKEELNVACEESVKTYFNALDGVELLICNAGVVQDQLLAKMSEGAWDEVLRVNLRGAFLCAKHVSQLMLKQKVGHILFIGSYAAFSPSMGQSNYAAAKAGLVGLTKSMATELGKKNIRVNLIAPGWMESKMTSHVSDLKLQQVREKHVLGAFNQPVAVAEFVKNLHQYMRYTSGQVFHLDSRIIP